jgi:uncharacterized protein (UPF0332 family)
MYHAARSLVFSRGYREKSHYCLYVALRELLVDQKLLGVELAETFRRSMRLRESADYQSDFSEEGASLAIEGAVQLLSKTREILDL